MKKILCGALAFLLLLGGCDSTTTAAAFDPEKTTRAILDSGAFSEELVELRPNIAIRLFYLPGEPEQYEGTVAYYSTGATSETVAVIRAGGADRAAQAVTALKQWVESQIEATRNYQPAEVEKLEHAILETRGDTVLLVVAADWEAARKAIT